MNSKRINNTRFLRSLSAIAGSGLVAGSAMGQDCYRIVDLGEIGPAAAASGPFGVNNAGRVVYTKEVDVGGSDKRHAFLNLPTPTPNNMATGCHDLHELCDGDVDRFDQAFIIAILVGGGGCGGGSSASAAEQAAGQMGFGSVGALAAWMTEVDNGQALGAGYVFSALGQAFLDE